MLSVRCSTFVGFYSDLTGRLQPTAELTPETCVPRRSSGSEDGTPETLNLKPVF